MEFANFAVSVCICSKNKHEHIIYSISPQLTLSLRVLHTLYTVSLLASSPDLYNNAGKSM